MTVLTANVQTKTKAPHHPDQLVSGNGFWEVLQAGEFAGRLGVSNPSRQRQDQGQSCCSKTCDTEPGDHMSLPSVSVVRPNGFPRYWFARRLWWGAIQLFVGNLSGWCQQRVKSRSCSRAGCGSNAILAARNEGLALLAFPELANTSDCFAVGDKSGNRLHDRAAGSVF